MALKEKNFKTVLENWEEDESPLKDSLQIKVKDIEKFSNPKIIGKYKVTKEYDYCYSKYNINNIEILVKNKPTSLFQHLNIGARNWSVNTQTGGINLMYNELENKKNLTKITIYLNRITIC